MSQNSEHKTHHVITPESSLFSWQCVLMLDWFSDLYVPEGPSESQLPDLFCLLHQISTKPIESSVSQFIRFIVCILASFSVLKHRLKKYLLAPKF